MFPHLNYFKVDLHLRCRCTSGALFRICGNSVSAKMKPKPHVHQVIHIFAVSASLLVLALLSALLCSKH